MKKSTVAPAYQEYTFNLNGSRKFQLLSHIERSMFFALKFELWQNDTIPYDFSVMARIIPIFTPKEFETYLPKLEWYFEISNNEITCPELMNQKKNTIERKKGNSKGGTNGGITKRLNKQIENEEKMKAQENEYAQARG